MCRHVNDFPLYFPSLHLPPPHSMSSAAPPTFAWNGGGVGAKVAPTGSVLPVYTLDGSVYSIMVLPETTFSAVAAAVRSRLGVAPAVRLLAHRRTGHDDFEPLDPERRVDVSWRCCVCVCACVRACVSLRERVKWWRLTQQRHLERQATAFTR